MPPTTIRPLPATVVVTTLALDHSAAWVPEAGTGVPVAVVMVAPPETANWDAGAAFAAVLIVDPKAVVAATTDNIRIRFMVTRAAPPSICLGK